MLIQNPITMKYYINPKYKKRVFFSLIKAMELPNMINIYMTIYDYE